jgi:hypothetical protein
MLRATHPLVTSLDMAQANDKTLPARDPKRVYTRTEIDELYRDYLKAVAAEIRRDRTAHRGRVFTLRPA